MVTAPARAVCIVEIRRSAGLAPSGHPVVPLGWPTPEPTGAPHPRLSTRPGSQTGWGCGHGGPRERHTSCNDQTGSVKPAALAGGHGRPPWPRHGPEWGQVAAGAGGRGRGARQSGGRSGRTPAAPARRLCPGSAGSPGARAPRRPGGCRGGAAPHRPSCRSSHLLPRPLPWPGESRTPRGVGRPRGAGAATTAPLGPRAARAAVPTAAGAWGLAPRRGPPRPTRGQAGGPLLCKAGGQTTRHTAWGPPRVTGGPPRGARARGRVPPSPPTRTWRVGAITVHPQDGERSSRFLAAASLRSPALRARRTADHASRCRGSRGTSPRQARAQARRGAAASIRPGHPGCAAPSKPRAVARLPSPAAPQARPRTSSAAAAGWPGKIGPGGSGQEPSHAVPCPGRQGPPGGGPWARRWFRPRQPRESPVLEGQPGLDGSTVRGRRLVSGMGAGRRGGGGWGSPVSGLPNPP